MQLRRRCGTPLVRRHLPHELQARAHRVPQRCELDVAWYGGTLHVHRTPSRRFA